MAEENEEDGEVHVEEEQLPEEKAVETSAYVDSWDQFPQMIHYTSGVPKGKLSKASRRCANFKHRFLIISRFHTF